MQGFTPGKSGVFAGGGEQDISGDLPADVFVIARLLAVVLQPPEQGAEFEGAVRQFLVFDRDPGLEYPVMPGLGRGARGHSGNRPSRRAFTCSPAFCGS
jgi:hypothetical protein